MPDIFQAWKATFLDLQRQVDEMFDELIYRRWAIASPKVWRPSMDLYEGKDLYIVEIDLPGVGPEEVRILAGLATLTIRGQRRINTPEKTTVDRCERASGNFQRSIDFAWLTEPEKAQAEYHLGSYRIVVPKKRPAEPASKQATVPQYVVQAVVR
jgi:HSP20 family protein